MKRFTIKRAAWGLWLGVVAGVAGCGGARPAAPAAVGTGEPLGLQMVRSDEQLKNCPFFTLLSFERDADEVFARTDGAKAVTSEERAHTGGRSLRLEAGTRTMAVRLESLHSGRKWPATWTLLGAYFYSPAPQRMTASYEVDGMAVATTTVQLPERQWTPVLLDIAAALEQRPEAPIGTLRFGFGQGLAGPIWCDDVIEIDNNAVLVDATAAGGWSVREQGFRYILERPLVFRMMLKTPEATGQGWLLDEANVIRARFHTPGPNRSRIVYSDGRDYLDGALHVRVAQSKQGPALNQHQNPAAITVSPELGRVERNASGDANNDGYAEAAGTYAVLAFGPRVTLLVTPRTPLLVGPVIEIGGLPEGKVLATMEGRLVEKVVRLDGGKVLIELPGTLDRPTTVDVRVQ